MSAAAVRLTPEAIARIRYWVERLPPVPAAEPVELPEPATVAEPVEAPPAPPVHQPIEEAPAQPVESFRVESRPPPTRDQLRSRRAREVRGRTLGVKRMTKRDIELGRVLYPETDYPKPRTRAECLDGPRPCPYVSCAYHLFLNVNPDNGSIKFNFPDLEVDQLAESCALDVADRGGATLEQCGQLLNVTREYIRQIELMAMAQVKRRNPRLVELVDQGGDRGRRRLPLLEECEDDDEAEEG